MRSRERRSAVAALALSMLLLICALSLAALGQANDVDAIVADLPRAFVGEFQWRTTIA
jgi:hypothetical protein